MTILLRNQTLKLLTAGTAVQTPPYYCTMPWKHIRHPERSWPLFYASIVMAGGWSWESRQSPETLTTHVRLIASNHGENRPDGCSWMCHQSVICVLPPCHQKQSSRHKGIMTHRWGPTVNPLSAGLCRDREPHTKTDYELMTLKRLWQS